MIQSSTQPIHTPVQWWHWLCLVSAYWLQCCESRSQSSGRNLWNLAFTQIWLKGHIKNVKNHRKLLLPFISGKLLIITSLPSRRVFLQFQLEKELFFLKRFISLIFDYVCLWGGHVCTCVEMLTKARGAGSPGAETTGSYRWWSGCSIQISGPLQEQCMSLTYECLQPWNELIQNIGQ